MLTGATTHSTTPHLHCIASRFAAQEASARVEHLDQVCLGHPQPVPALLWLNTIKQMCPHTQCKLIHAIDLWWFRLVA